MGTDRRTSGKFLMFYGFGCDVLGIITIIVVFSKALTHPYAIMAPLALKPLFPVVLYFLRKKFLPEWGQELQEEKERTGEWVSEPILAAAGFWGAIVGLVGLIRYLRSSG